MCDALHMSSSAFDKMPLKIDSTDPLFNVGTNELRNAMQTPSEHPWVADWLFKDNAHPFHTTPSTLPPEAFDNSLALHLHHNISVPCACPPVATKLPAASNFIMSHQPNALPKLAITKDLDFLLVPVAKLSGITVGYAFLRGIEQASMHAMYSSSIFNGPPNGSHFTSPPNTDKPISIARFCFHHARTDYTMAVSGIVGKLMGIVSMRWKSSTARDRCFIIVPNASYGAHCLPSRVLTIQFHTDYRVPVPDDNGPTAKSDHPSGDTAHTNGDASLPMSSSFDHLQTTAVPKSAPDYSPTGAAADTNTSDAHGWSHLEQTNTTFLQESRTTGSSTDQISALGAVGTLVSPSASGEILPDVVHDYYLNYIDTELYDQVLKDPTTTPASSYTNALNLRPPPPDATIDEILSATSSLVTQSQMALNPGSTSTSSASYGNKWLPDEDVPISLESVLPAFDESDEVPMFVDDYENNMQTEQNGNSIRYQFGNWKAEGEKSKHLNSGTNGWWLMSSGIGMTPDGVGVPRRPGENNTSSGAFDVRELRDALASIESSFKGVFFGPRVRKDIMHPQTGELLSRSTGEMSAQLFRTDDATVNMMRRIAAQSYYANILAVSSDSRFITLNTTTSFANQPRLLEPNLQQQQHQYQQYQTNQHTTSSPFHTSSTVSYAVAAPHTSEQSTPMETGPSQVSPSNRSQVASHIALPPSLRSTAFDMTVQQPHVFTGPSTPSRRKSTPHKAPSPIRSQQQSPLKIGNGNGMILSNSVPAKAHVMQLPSHETVSAGTSSIVDTSLRSARQTVPFKRHGVAPLAPRPVSLLTAGSVSATGAPTTPGISGADVKSAGKTENSRESKLEAKRIRNRLSAAKSNQKRREHLEAQKKELSQLKARVEHLRSRHTLIVKENELLRNQISADNFQATKG